MQTGLTPEERNVNESAFAWKPPKKENHVNLVKKKIFSGFNSEALIPSLPSSLSCISESDLLPVFSIPKECKSCAENVNFPQSVTNFKLKRALPFLY